MAIVCMKIGENEPDTYLNFYQLSKHLDIVDLIDKDHPGVSAVKEFLCFKVDLSHLDKTEFNRLRSLITEQDEELLGYEVDPDLGDRVPIMHAVQKRRRLFRLDLVDWISAPTKTDIDSKTVIKRAVKPQLYTYQSDNGLTVSNDVLLTPSKDLNGEYNRRLLITGTGTFEVGQYNKLSDEGKRRVLNIITKEHLAQKRVEFEVAFDMTPVNDLTKTITYNQMADFTVDKITGRTLAQDF